MTTEEQQPERTTINSIDGLSCSTCFYWTQARLAAALNGEREPDRMGRCSRHPPLAEWDEERGGSRPVFVFTPATYCCGDWKTDAEPPPELGLAEVGGP